MVEEAPFGIDDGRGTFGIVVEAKRIKLQNDSYLESATMLHHHGIIHFADSIA